MKPNMRGVGIALITPFSEDGSVDFGALEALVERVTAGGADYLVVLGTTAETPTLTADEKEAVVSCVVRKNNGRLPVVLGMGGNNTVEVVASIRKTDFTGIDAILTVTPYYNKATQAGLIAHYEAVAKEAKKQGIDLKVVEFSDYVTPDKALADGDIQLNAYQHVPFMENFNKQNGSNLVAIGKTILVRMGLYSNSVHSVQDVPEGATVSIPNDPTNGGRALALLAKAGLITLKDGVGFKATVADITSNPKNIKIQELEAAQLPRSLDDVTIAVIPMNYVQSAGLSVEKQGFFFESKDEPLTVIVLAVRSEDKDNETYKKIADIYKSDAIKQFINDTFKGSITSAN